MTNTAPSAPYLSQSLRWREDIKFLTSVVSKAALRPINWRREEREDIHG